MNKAIFLDRDGVINFERGYTHRLEDFRILPGVMDVLRGWQAKGYLFVIVSNQSGIGKDLYKQEDVELIHGHLMDEFKKEGIQIAEVYYCVHHPDSGRCICRKPDSLFLEKAIARFAIDPARSFFIGDKDRDVEAGEKAGVKGILIEANTPLQNILHLIP